MNVRPMIRSIAGVTALAAVTAGLGAFSAAPAGAAAAKKPALPGDFNGDGLRDTASGGPEGRVNGKEQAGFVTVVYSTKAGPDAKKRQLISKASPGIPGSPHSPDSFGAAIASADFDKDGYADLAILAGSSDKNNSVVVVYGGKKGLTKRTIVLKAPIGYRLGAKMVVGDFDHDGSYDIVVTNDNAFWTFKGVRKRGVTGVRTLVKGVGAYRELSPAAADFNGDHRTDLALLVIANDGDDDPFDSWGELRLGTKSGLGARTEFGKHQTGEGVAAGDINGDGRADLVSEVFNTGQRGSFQVRLGGKKGFGAAKTYNQDSPGIPGEGQETDNFGASMSVGDINGDGKGDVVVGAPWQTIGPAQAAGTATVLYGTKDGLITKGAQLFGEDTPGVPGKSEIQDGFGRSLSLADLNGDRRADLAVGAPNERGGVLYYLPGTKGGVTVQGVRYITTKDLGIPTVNPEFGGILLP